MSSRKSDKIKKLSRDSKLPSTVGTPADQSEFAVNEPPPENHEDNRTIIITINSFRKILPLYPVSDIRVKLKYLDREIGESQLVAITDNENLPLNESFEIVVDVNNPRQLDLIASNPVFITAVQSSGTMDPELYEQLQKSKEDQKPTQEVDSLFSIYEAFTGEKPAVQLSDAKKKKKKEKKEKSEKGTRDKSTARSKSVLSRTSDKSKASKSSKGSTKSGIISKSEPTVVIKSEVYGMCVIDLIPLLFGKHSFSETLLLQPIKRSCQILSTFKNFPEILLTVSLKDDDQLIDINNILYFTVESMCNAPSMMLTDMECRICTLLPLQNNGQSPTIFFNPKITSKAPPKEVPKRWPGIIDIGYNANTTKYLIDPDFSEVVNKAGLNIEEAFQEEAPRVEFNYIKRNLMYKSSNNEFAAHVLTYRKLVLEIYFTPKTKKSKTYDPFSDEAEEMVHTKNTKPSKIPPYLHLMAVVDVVALLYPGVTKLRVASPVKTFTFEEAAKNGLLDSYFLPKPKVDLTGKGKKGDGKKKNGEKKDKFLKKDKGSSAKEEKNLASQLPPSPEEPPPPDPSLQVYNEEGKPCFILVEIELLRPITPKREVEELQLELHNLQLNALQSSKTIISKSVADDLYQHSLKEIVDDLNKHWIKYNELMNSIPQPNVSGFVEYLQKVGAYQSYLNSITTSATLLITNKYQCEETDFRNNKNYQNLISEVFVELISQMHGVLNGLVCTGMKSLEDKYPTSLTDVLFYAKEAAEMQLYQTADRYFLERICNDHETRSDFWLDYAIYNIEVNSTEKALECLLQAIALDCSQKYALLLYAALLTDKGQIQDAETCLLNLLVQQAKWAEGWCVLYLFYQKSNRADGMEVALDMGKKMLQHVVNDDYLSEFEELAWTSKNIPDTLFFKTAVLLLKMRLYSWVELALAEEVLVPKHYGYVNYLLAVVSYYKKDYEHGLEHLEEAKEYLGADIGILSLSGHTLYRQGELEKSKQDYFKVIESFDRPDDIYLVYVNCSEALAKLGEDQMARKLILMACKHHQTPHVWYLAGKLYFSENDLLSAEECFNEANMKDNKHAEVWAYLTLINLKLNRLHEAEQCYQQAVRSKLEDRELLQEIISKFSKD